MRPWSHRPGSGKRLRFCDGTSAEVARVESGPASQRSGSRGFVVGDLFRNSTVHAQNSSAQETKKMKWIALALSTGLTAALTITAAHGQGMVIYPGKGQSPDQQNKDKGECHVWAVQQSGFDPA